LARRPGPILLLTVAVLAPCACRMPRGSEGGDTISAAAARAEPGGREASTLGSGDLLEVRVFQEADLTGPFRLSPEGTIDYPGCGKVKLAGMTSSQAADALTQCLAAHWVRRPQVTVLQREYNSKKIFVFGEVNKPGTFPFEENMSIIQAITLANGFTKIASKNSTSVTRIIEGEEKKIRVPVEDIGVGREKNFPLRPGDIVFVPESFL
jgi:protein involved in polysaccharide export with SLBB domain